MRNRAPLKWNSWSAYRPDKWELILLLKWKRHWHPHPWEPPLGVSMRGSQHQANSSLHRGKTETRDLGDCLHVGNTVYDWTHWYQLFPGHLRKTRPGCHSPAWRGSGTLSCTVRVLGPLHWHTSTYSDMWKREELWMVFKEYRGLLQSFLKS